MPARAKKPRKTPRPAKSIQAKLKESQDNAKEFEAELEEVFEQAREDGHKQAAPA